MWAFLELQANNLCGLFIVLSLFMSLCCILYVRFSALGVLLPSLLLVAVQILYVVLLDVMTAAPVPLKSSYSGLKQQHHQIRNKRTKGTLKSSRSVSPLTMHAFICDGDTINVELWLCNHIITALHAQSCCEPRSCHLLLGCCSVREVHLLIWELPSFQREVRQTT